MRNLRLKRLLAGVAIFITAALLSSLLVAYFTSKPPTDSAAGPPTTSSPTAPATPMTPVATASATSANEVSPTQLATLGVCPLPCHATGQVTVEHPLWGQVSVFTVQFNEDLSSHIPARIIAIDASGRLQWQYTVEGLVQLKPAEPSRDRIDHLFLMYNPGRYDGIIVLTPTKYGFEDFGSLPTSGETTGRFYSSHLSDVDGDHIYEIVSEKNTCDPSCANGRVEVATWAFNGKDYADH
jgi:hypothetical protein